MSVWSKYINRNLNKIIPFFSNHLYTCCRSFRDYRGNMANIEAVRQEVQANAASGFMDDAKFHMIDGGVRTVGCSALYVCLPRAVQSVIYKVCIDIFNPASPLYTASVNAFAVPLSTAGFSIAQSVIYPILLYQGGKWILKSAYHIGCGGHKVYLRKQAMDEFRKLFEAELAKQEAGAPKNDAKDKEVTEEGFVLL